MGLLCAHMASNLKSYSYLSAATWVHVHLLRTQHSIDHNFNIHVFPIGVRVCVSLHWNRKHSDPIVFICRCRKKKYVCFYSNTMPQFIPGMLRIDSIINFTWSTQPSWRERTKPEKKSVSFMYFVCMPFSLVSIRLFVLIMLTFFEISFRCEEFKAIFEVSSSFLYKCCGRAGW